MSAQRRNRIKEPRKGALIVALILAIIVIAVVAAYFVFSPSHVADNLKDKNNFTHHTSNNAKSYSNSTSAISPSDPKLKLPGEKNDYPTKGVISPNSPPFSDIKSGTARLAIIVDDMGNSMSEARSLAAIGVPINFSVIPGLRNYREVALFAASKGIETMIHIPMQSKGWPERRLEGNGLLVQMDDAELQERMFGFIRDIPGAVGVNNHMGSEFTEHEDKIKSVLETLKSKNLFFVDSVTSTNTAGLRVAQELGIKSGRRNVFLDNEQERGYILGQLAQAVKLAKKNGFAISICHPHPETIATLTYALPKLAGQGVTLVPVSQIVR